MNIFTDRLGRRAYLFSLLTLYSILIGLLLIIITLQNSVAMYLGWQNIYVDFFFFLLPFVLYYPFRIAIDARRFRDMGFSGYLSLLHFLPYISFFITLVLLFKSKRIENNKYGTEKEVFSFSNLFKGNYLEEKQKEDEKKVYRILTILVLLFVLASFVESLPFSKSEYGSSEEKAQIDSREEELIAGAFLRAL